MQTLFQRLQRIGLFIKQKYTPDIAISILILLFSFALWWPTQYLPYHWDAAGFFNNAVQHLIDTDFQPLQITNSDFAHPPLLISVYALLFSLLGRSLQLAHIVFFPFLPTLVIASYYLAKKFHSTLIAIAVAFATLATPVIVAEYGIIYIDLPAASLALSALALWMYRRYRVATLLFTLAVMTKMTVILLTPLFILPWLLKEWPVQKIPKHIWYLSIPLVSIIIWLLYHYQVTGWLLTKPGRSMASPANLPQLFSSISFVASELFLSQGKWVISSIATVCVLIMAIIGKIGFIRRNNHLFSLLIQLAIILTAFSLSGEFATRYGIFTYPLVYLAGFMIIVQSIKEFKPKWSARGIFISAFVTVAALLLNWHTSQGFTAEYEFRPPNDLSYQDIIRINREAALYIQLFYANDLIYGSFPENVYLTQPWHGYVDTPLNVKLCSDFTYRPGTRQILYMHAYSPGQVRCRQLLDGLTVEPIRRFESQDKWLELYEVSSASAQVTE